MTLPFTKPVFQRHSVRTERVGHVWHLQLHYRIGLDSSHISFAAHHWLILHRKLSRYLNFVVLAIITVVVDSGSDIRALIYNGDLDLADSFMAAQWFVDRIAKDQNVSFFLFKIISWITLFEFFLTLDWLYQWVRPCVVLRRKISWRGFTFYLF